MKHVTVFGQPGIYAGWPANHGHWQWGNELLFGFIRGKHVVAGMHHVMGRLEKVLARSLDGGETWTVEVPNVDFDARKTKPMPKGARLRGCIIRVCGGYDHGGDACDMHGGYYLSYDRGKTWQGAYSFAGLEFSEEQKATSRTCVLDNLIFLSTAHKYHWGSDSTYCARIGNNSFAHHSVVLDDAYRAVMPAAVRIEDRIVVALRRRGAPRVGGWIDSVFSDDGGLTWSEPVQVAATGKDNGNPPALIEAGGTLYCAYANRSRHTIEVMQSGDAGLSWVEAAELRRGNTPDIGYPRLFKRSDGKLVCVYYWTEEFEKAQRIEATIFN